MENSIVKIKGNANELIFETAFLLHMCGYAFYTVPGWGIGIYYAFYLLFLGAGAYYSLGKILRTRSLSINMFTVWNLIFVLVAALSVLWAVSLGDTLDIAFRLFQNLITAYFLTDYVTNSGRMRRILNLTVFSVVFLAVTILIFTPVSQWFAGDIGNFYYNRNITSGIEIIGAIISLVLAFTGGEKKYYLCYFFLFLMVILSSSRRGIITLVAVSVMVILLSSGRKHLVRNILICLLVPVIVIVAIKNIPFLSDTIGKTMGDLVQYYFSGSTPDGSVAKRELYVAKGIEIFLTRPLTGYGGGAFIKLFSEDYGTSHYTHNNFVELLVSYGIIGFIAYYWIYPVIILKSVKGLLERNVYKILSFTLAIAMLISHVGTVSFYSKTDHVYLIISWLLPWFSYMQSSKKLKRRN